MKKATNNNQTVSRGKTSEAIGSCIGKKLTIVLIAVLFAVVALLFAGCSKKNDETKPADSAQSREVEDSEKADEAGDDKVTDKAGDDKDADDKAVDEADDDKDVDDKAADEAADDKDADDKVVVDGKVVNEADVADDVDGSGSTEDADDAEDVEDAEDADDVEDAEGADNDEDDEYADIVGTWVNVSVESEGVKYMAGSSEYKENFGDDEWTITFNPDKTAESLDGELDWSGTWEQDTEDQYVVGWYADDGIDEEFWVLDGDIAVVDEDDMIFTYQKR